MLDLDDIFFFLIIPGLFLKQSDFFATLAEMRTKISERLKTIFPDRPLLNDWSFDEAHLLNDVDSASALGILAVIHEQFYSSDSEPCLISVKKENLFDNNKVAMEKDICFPPFMLKTGDILVYSRRLISVQSKMKDEHTHSAVFFGTD